ncbi:uncharacterized protein LOC106647552 [Copidosoma floridanum]|uniref:uncharacterized protein LOC106647552 n=1 Tax=Copidosoma floridanum TaxID=29053 RepID=UPI0006C99271|nr:uncharacterized protein LOC106647552 [Copidosoma floridanum]
MMLHRSASSRRRRASRSVTSPHHHHPQQQQQQQAHSTSPQGRRASIASAEPSSEALIVSATGMDRQRAPRGSCVPNIALDNDVQALEENFNRRLLPDPEQCGASRLCLAGSSETSRSRSSLAPEEYLASGRSPRSSLVPDLSSRSSRNSLIPDGSMQRSPRNSLVPESMSRSPRHSLVPDQTLSPRNSLVPLDVVGYNRSPRGSLVPTGPVSVDSAAAAVGGPGGSRLAGGGLVLPENGSLGRSPRHSLVPETAAQLRSSRTSVANVAEFDRSPRGSICPDASARSPRGSITPVDLHGDMKERSPRGSIASECPLNQSPRGSIIPDQINRSPRGSIAPDINRSPRGSICPEASNRSPRGSITPGHHEQFMANRSPRGSIGMGEYGHRGSLGGEDDLASRSPRGSIGPNGLDRSPRGSLGGGERRLPKFNVQEHRRASVDQSTAMNRSSSPYRQQQQQPQQKRTENTGSLRSTHQMGAIGYGAANFGIDSRRASSSPSQISVNESRRLCGTRSASVAEKGATGSSAPMGVAAYGSLVFQLKDAHLEASGTCDFVYRALRVVSKTTVVTVFLAFMTTIPLVMLILGVQSVRDCPREPNIPLYMVVGGSLGSVRMFWLVISRIRSRRPVVVSMPNNDERVSCKMIASILLSLFLIGWFALGNYWILRIRWPDYEPKHYDPNQWCDKTLYIFALVHLGIVYFAVSVSIVVGIGLLFCRILACPWPERYK